MKTNKFLLVLNQEEGDGIDSDAAVFISAAGITDATQINAINYLVVELKSNGIWDKMSVIYPFVGGTASAHSYNLKDTSTYQISWGGTALTHDSNGITGNSVGYGDTGYIHNDKDSLNIGTYIRNNVPSTSAIGVTQNTPNVSSILFPSDYLSRINSPTTLSLPARNPQGHTVASTSLIDRTDYSNGVVIGTLGSAGGSAVNTIPMYIMARNLIGSAGSQSIFNISLSHIGDGITGAEALTLYNIIQQYQTILGRQV